MLRRVFAAGILMAGVGIGHEASAQELPAQEPPTPVGDDKSFYELIGEDDPNPTTYEFSFLSIGIDQTWGLANWRGGGVYFGAGGGLGTPIYRISKMEDRDIGMDPTLEAVYGNIFFRLIPVKYVDIDVGGRIAVGATTYDIDDAPRGGFIRAGYVNLRVGSSRIKLGPRFEYTSMQYDTFSEEGWKITPLMLRVVSN